MFTKAIARLLVGAGLIAAATLAGSTQASASPYGGFAATCSSAANADERFWTNMSWASFQSWNTQYYTEGLRLTQIDVDGHGVTATWHPGSGTQLVQPDLSMAQLEGLDKQYFAQGLRLVDLDEDGGDWTAVWRPGSGAQHWHAGIQSWSIFGALNDGYFHQGLRLVDVVITDDDFITGVWRADQGSSGQIVEAGIPGAGADSNNESEFQKRNRLAEEAGWELRILRTHPDDSYVMAVWRFRGGSFTQSTNLYLTTAGIKSMRTACFASGRRLVSVDVK